MKAIVKFLKATLLGGLLFVGPILAIIVFIIHSVRIVSEKLLPLAEMLPFGRVAGIIVADLLAVVVLVAACFAAGIFVTTRLGRMIGNRTERMVTRLVPGFKFYKSITHGLAGLETDSEIAVVLAEFDDAWQLAFVVERNPGGLVTLFIPGAPTAMSGGIYFMTEDRLTPLNVPVLKAMGCISRLGVGSSELFELAGSPQFGPSAERRRGKQIE